jgi:hypothetical protein
MLLKNTKMNLKIFRLIFFLLLFSGCASHETKIPEFDPRSIDGETLTLSGIADDITYVPLDNAFPLDRILSIYYNKSIIYLNSRNIGILTYRKNGQLINKIGNIGRGPEEYLIYTYFCVSDKSGNIYNNSNMKDLIQVFSPGGLFLRSFKLESFSSLVSDLKFYNDKLIVQCSAELGYDYDWVAFDTLGLLLKKQVRHLPKFDVNYGRSTEPYIFNNKLTYYNAWSDTIFSITPVLTEKPNLFICPGDFRYPRGRLSLKQLIEGNYLDYQIFETINFFVIKYRYNKNFYIAFIDKNRKNNFLNLYKTNFHTAEPESGIINDLDGGSWFLPVSYYMENGDEYLIGIQYPSQIKAHVSSEEFKNSNPKMPAKKKEFEELAASLKETDNPVLMIVRLKK